MILPEYFGCSDPDFSQCLNQRLALLGETYTTSDVLKLQKKLPVIQYENYEEEEWDWNESPFSEDEVNDQ